MEEEVGEDEDPDLEELNEGEREEFHVGYMFSVKCDILFVLITVF